jgi:hypothetical protein
MTNSSDKRKPTAGTATVGAPVNLMGTLALSLTRQNAIRLGRVNTIVY